MVTTAAIAVAMMISFVAAPPAGSEPAETAPKMVVRVDMVICIAEWCHVETRRM